MQKLKTLVTAGFLVYFTGIAPAQNCIPTNINGTVFNFACNQACPDLNFQIPHIKSTDDYRVITIPYSPYPFSTPSGNELSETYIDDQFSHLNALPFTVCFYGALFNSFVAGSNGVVSFDAAQANCKNAWPLETFFGSGVAQPVPFVGPGTCTDKDVKKFPRFSIMGPYHDLNPSVTANSPQRKIEWRVEGNAPCRKLVVSFYQVPLYGDNFRLNTHQVVVHESTGIVDVFIEAKQLVSGANPWNGNFAILALQKDDTKAIAAPGKNGTVWSENNTGYRFIPSAGVSRFLSSRLYTLSGTLLATADTSTVIPALLNLRFPAVCIPPGNNTYVIKTVFSACDNPAVQIESSDTVSAIRAADLNASATVVNTDCGAPSGSITVTVPPASGNPPFTYVLDGGAPVTAGSPYTFTGMVYGPHTVNVTETGGCNSVLNVTVNRNNSITSLISTTATACAGIGTGTIQITPSNGIAPYTYQLDGFLPVAGPVPYTFTNVFGGSHNIIVYDATGCQSGVVAVNVPTGAGVNGAVSSSIASCAEISNASITITATAGTAPFMWQLDGATPVAGTSPYVFSGVAAGAHSVNVIDNNGCTKNFSVNVVAGPGADGTVTTLPATCPGAANGSVTVTATLGTAPFTFQLDGGPFQTGSSPYVFNGVLAGQHTVTIRDNNGCTKTINLAVNAGPGPSGTAVTAATSCNGASNGSITVTASSGISPYLFSLDGNTPVPGVLSHTFTNLPAGNHSIIITDAAGCMSGTLNATILSGPVISTTVNIQPVLCNGDATGSITVNQPALGTAPFQYSMDGIVWQTSNLFTGLAAGTYTVFYRSANGCMGSQSITITEPAKLTAAVAVTPARCQGDNNGIINVTAAGGAGPYQYSANGGVNWQGSNIFNLPAGNYSVKVKDANGCITSTAAVITEPARLTATSVNLNASCDGGNDGRIIINAAGGNGNYLYSLDGNTFQTSNTFNLPPGQYSPVVIDNLGCRTTFPATVGLTINLYLGRLQDTSICEGTSGQLQLVTNATNFSWSPAAGLSSTVIANPVAAPASTTQYIVQVTLGRCSTNDTMIIRVNPAPVPNAGPDGDICYGQSYVLRGSGGTQYAWSPPLYLNIATGPGPVATPAFTTIYALSVTDAIGCRSLVTDSVTVKVSQPLRVITYPFDTLAYPGEQVQLMAVSAAGISYQWSPAIRISNTQVPNPIITAGNIGEDIQYKVVATTADGCKGEGYVTIRVSKGPAIYVPTGFTPNADGLNDLFLPVPVGIRSFTFFRIYNRWGQQVFSTSRLNEGWNGSIGGKEQPAGTYIWEIRAIADGGQVIFKKGIITLIR